MGSEKTKTLKTRSWKTTTFLKNRTDNHASTSPLTAGCPYCCPTIWSSWCHCHPSSGNLNMHSEKDLPQLKTNTKLINHFICSFMNSKVWAGHTRLGKQLCVIIKT